MSLPGTEEGLLKHEIDAYNGVLVNDTEQYSKMDELVFGRVLKNSMEQWKKDKRGGVWLKVRLFSSSLYPNRFQPKGRPIFQLLLSWGSFLRIAQALTYCSPRGFQLLRIVYPWVPVITLVCGSSCSSLNVKV